MPDNIENGTYGKLIKLDFLEKNEIQFFLFGRNFPVFIESIKSDWDDETYLISPLRKAVEKLISLADEYIDNAVKLGELTVSHDTVDRFLFSPYQPASFHIRGKVYALVQVFTRLKNKHFPIPEELIKAIESSRWEEALSLIPDLQTNMFSLSKKVEEALGSGEVELQPIVDKFFNEHFKAEKNAMRHGPEDKEISLGSDEAGEVGGNEVGAKPKQDWSRIESVALNAWESSGRTLKIVDIYKHIDVREALSQGEPVTQKYVETNISSWISAVKEKEDNALKNDTQKGRKLRLSKR